MITYHADKEHHSKIAVACIISELSEHPLCSIVGRCHSRYNTKNDKCTNTNPENYLKMFCIELVWIIVKKV